MQRKLHYFRVTTFQSSTVSKLIKMPPLFSFSSLNSFKGNRQTIQLPRGQKKSQTNWQKKKAIMDWTQSSPHPSSCTLLWLNLYFQLLPSLLAACWWPVVHLLLGFNGCIIISYNVQPFLHSPEATELLLWTQKGLKKWVFPTALATRVGTGWLQVVLQAEEHAINMFHPCICGLPYALLTQFLL